MKPFLQCIFHIMSIDLEFWSKQYFNFETKIINHLLPCNNGFIWKNRKETYSFLPWMVAILLIKDIKRNRDIIIHSWFKNKSFKKGTRVLVFSACPYVMFYYPTFTWIVPVPVLPLQVQRVRTGTGTGTIMYVPAGTTRYSNCTTYLWFLVCWLASIITT